MSNLAFRSASDAGSNTGTVNNVDVALPTGTASGDLQTIWVGVGVAAPGTPPNVGTPSGWTLPSGGTSGTISLLGGTFNVIFKLFYKIAGGSEGTVNLANDGGSNSTFSVLRKSYQNPDGTTPFGQVSWSPSAGGPGTSVVVPSITTGEPNALIDILIQQGAAANCTPPGSMTERIDNATYGYSCADEIIPAAGATGTRTFTIPGSADYLYGIAEFRSANPPVITVQPTDQIAADGSTASFTTTVTGATSYQWETLAPLGGSWGNVSGGTGATSDDYTTGTLSRASDAGRQYRLKATNANGDTYSNVVQARVTAIPTAYDFGGFVIGANS